MYIGLGIALLVIGAILSFAIGADAVSGINLEMIGWILMAGGILAILLSLVMRGSRTRGYTSRRVSGVDPASGQRYDEVDVDPR